MAVSDRWHKSKPAPGDETCGEHGKLVPSKDHGRGDRWLVRWRDETGKQKAKSFTKRSDAASHDAEIKRQLDKGTYVDPKAGEVKFEDYAREWMKGVNSDPATVEWTERHLRLHAYPVLGHQQMMKLARTPSTIQQWIKGLSDKLAPATVKGVVTCVSSVFAAALEDGIVSRNPCKGRTLPKMDKRKIVPLTLEQVEALAESLEPRYRALVALGVGCGLRQGELFGIAREDITIRTLHVKRQVRRIPSGQLLYSPPKGGKERRVALPETVARELSAHMERYGTAKVELPWWKPGQPTEFHELLFASPADDPLTRNGFNKRWRAARRAAGLPNTRAYGMHVLRHTAASAWLAAGVDIRTVSELLGHSDPGFTLRTYAHLMPDAHDRARAAMDAFFSAPDVHRAGGE